MTELACAFRGNVFRADICQGTATIFFRSAKGTLWPMCDACNERHKDVARGIIQRGQLPATVVAQATFDIPITAETLFAFREQDPSLIDAAFQRADKALLDNLSKRKS